MLIIVFQHVLYMFLNNLAKFHQNFDDGVDLPYLQDDGVDLSYHDGVDLPYLNDINHIAPSYKVHIR